ncbi:MAG: hypothetical protein NVV73_07935 [Cellvibrionaceae bacterium]|nr:hypothetical protein [Cellvibrionaceae bacterium]
MGATVKRLDRGATVMIVVIFLAIKWTGKLAINIVRYSMGIAIFGLIIWPYRLLVAPTCAVAAGIASTPDEDHDDVDMFGNPVEKDIFGNVIDHTDHSVSPVYVDNQTGQFTLSSHNSYEYDEKEWWV